MFDDPDEAASPGLFLVALALAAFAWLMVGAAVVAPLMIELF